MILILVKAIAILRTKKRSKNMLREKKRVIKSIEEIWLNMQLKL